MAYGGRRKERLELRSGSLLDAYFRLGEWGVVALATFLHCFVSIVGFAALGTWCRVLPHDGADLLLDGLLVHVCGGGASELVGGGKEILSGICGRLRGRLRFRLRRKL